MNQESAPPSSLIESLRAGGDLSEGTVLPLVDAIVTEAVHRRASDIHLEPFRSLYRLRYRIDGRFITVGEYQSELGQRIISRLKVMSRLQVYKVSTPQEGRIHLESGQGLDLRTSFFPTINGEKGVIRIFSFAVDRLSLDYLGFEESVKDAVRRMISLPQGNIFVVGPAGVGKTTTLYAMLKEIHDVHGTSRSLATIEDPVENNLGFLPQTEINNAMGLSFATALRSLLRQDPEVIMVGEIRDPETASIAIQAGLTGHLVLSSIHADRAFSLFSRLIDLDCSLALILASLTGILSQRLIRRLCPKCRDVGNYSRDLLERYGLLDKQLYRASGCPACLGTGFEGRTAVGELLILDREIKRAIRSSLPAEEMEDFAMKRGFVPVRESAVRLLLDGKTSLEEILPSFLEVHR